MHLRPESKRNTIEMYTLVLFFTISFSILYCDGHGRLIEPPSRASAWRYGFQTPPDYNDHELYCGGFTRQWTKNSGKCGECGDPWDLPEPRPHESGGQWGQGLIVRSYFPGSKIMIRVELTASHMGYFEFRLCPKPNAKQSCLDQNILPIISGFPSQPSPTDLQSRFYPRNGSRIYEINARLPELTCAHCVLQWRYIAGNNWGICDDGNGAVGCGPQEEFRSCSDISLSLDFSVRTGRPLLTKSTQSTKILQATDNMSQNSHSEPLKYWLLIVIVLITFLCILAVRHRTFLRKIIFFGVKSDLSETDSDVSNNKVHSFPIPPPRAKKLGNVIKVQVDQSTSV